MKNSDHRDSFPPYFNERESISLRDGDLQAHNREQCRPSSRDSDHEQRRPSSRDSDQHNHEQRRPSSRDSDQSYGHDVIVVPDSYYGKPLVKYVGTLTKYFFNATGNHTAFLDSKIFLPLDICSPLVTAGILRVKEKFMVDAKWNPKKMNWVAVRIQPASTPAPLCGQLEELHGHREDFKVSQYTNGHAAWEQSVIRSYLDRSRPFHFDMP
jgi:hypothetical protein